MLYVRDEFAGLDLFIIFTKSDVEHTRIVAGDMTYALCICYTQVVFPFDKLVEEKMSPVFESPAFRIMLAPLSRNFPSLDNINAFSQTVDSSIWRMLKGYGRSIAQSCITRYVATGHSEIKEIINIVKKELEQSQLVPPDHTLQWIYLKN